PRCATIAPRAGAIFALSPVTSKWLSRLSHGGCFGALPAKNRIRSNPFRGLPDMKILPPVSIEARRLLPSRWDLLAAVLVLGFIVLFADASRLLVQPLSVITGNKLSLDPALLPGYALRTALRMLIAMGVSLVF